MSKPPAPEIGGATAAKRRRINAFTTATVVSFSLTLLGGSIAVLTNMVCSSS